MIGDPSPEGTSGMKRSGRRYRVKVSADGNGVVSHSGCALLRELATETGLAGAVTGGLDAHGVAAAGPDRRGASWPGAGGARRGPRPRVGGRGGAGARR